MSITSSIDKDLPAKISTIQLAQILDGIHFLDLRRFDLDLKKSLQSKFTTMLGEGFFISEERKWLLWSQTIKAN